MQQLAGESPDFENAFGDPAQNLGIAAFTLSGLSASFNYTVPAYSVTVLRIPQK